MFSVNRVLYTGHGNSFIQNHAGSLEQCLEACPGRGSENHCRDSPGRYHDYQMMDWF